MESSKKKNLESRQRRTQRIRKKVRGTSDKPRMCVIKSNKHLYVQLINDEEAVTIAAFSTQAKELRGSACGKKNKDAAKVLGEKIAQIALAKGIKEIVFDRGSFRYQGNGILAHLADSARAQGLQF
jgi:large subunit ribosomal protein L18